MKKLAKGLVGTALVVSALSLGACAASSTSYGVGGSSYDSPRDAYATRGDNDWDGIPNRFDRDRDGDGIPNRFDSRPNNPRWR